MGRKRQCKVCKKPVSGHRGPWGKGKCRNSVSSQPKEDSISDCSDTPESPEKTNMDRVYIGDDLLKSQTDNPFIGPMVFDQQPDMALVLCDIQAKMDSMLQSVSQVCGSRSHVPEPRGAAKPGMTRDMSGSGNPQQGPHLATCSGARPKTSYTQQQAWPPVIDHSHSLQGMASGPHQATSHTPGINQQHAGGMPANYNSVQHGSTMTGGHSHSHAGEASHAAMCSCAQGMQASLPSQSIPGLRSIEGIQDLRQFSPVSSTPDKTLKAALCGEYINLDDFLNNLIVPNDTISDIQSYVDQSGNISYRQKYQKRRINDILTWLEAWAGYEATMISFQGPQLYSSMVSYRLKMIEFSKKYVWASVATLDMRHRASISRKSLDFAFIDPEMITSVLDATAIRPSAQRCLRCRSYNHTVKDCPFPGESIPTTKAKSKFANDICNNWNNLKCTFKTCRRQHICRQCKGPLPFEKCRSEGKCATATTKYAGNI